MYKADVYIKNKLIHSVTYECKTAEEAKIAVINSMYWNVVTCSEASEPKWWLKYQYQITKLSNQPNNN